MPLDGDIPLTDLKAPYGPLAFFLDLHPDLGDFRADAAAGLAMEEKCISPKYFYDERGSKLFDEITTLDEYYPTRTERSLFLQYADEIARAVGPRAAIFEYGSGSSEKVEWLANGLDELIAYVAMDISKDHLIESSSALAEALQVPVAAVCGDFQAPVPIPDGVLPRPDRWLGYFPGSTIGNMTPTGAAGFLNRASATLGPNAKFLIGFDLEKDQQVLEAAYNDARGITAAFNLNVLRRMKRELSADVDLDAFEHIAFYNRDLWRIEMHLRAVRDTVITLDGADYSFSEGETLHTENSHKYSLDRFAALVDETPWSVTEHWVDDKAWYAACLLSNG